MDIAASPPIRRDETVQVALLLAFAGGYLDAYTWIIHGVMANAQTANLVLLWVYGTTGEWARALHFVPPMLAFAVGIVMATFLRSVDRRAGQCDQHAHRDCDAGHGRHPAQPPAGSGGHAGHFVRCRHASRDIHQGRRRDLQLGDDNRQLRQAIEGLFAVVSGQFGSLRRPGIFAALCVAFGIGAAVGAYATKVIPDLALGLPVVALLIVLLRCEIRPNGEDP